MRKGRDREEKEVENGMENEMKNNGENSSLLTSLPIDSLNAMVVPATPTLVPIELVCVEPFYGHCR